jgi:hypothetical protein
MGAKPRIDQAVWLSELGDVPGIASYVVTPDMLDMVLAWLA